MLSSELQPPSPDSNPRECENYDLRKKTHVFYAQANAQKSISLKKGHGIDQSNELADDSERLLAIAVNFCKGTRCQIQDRCVDCISEDTKPLREELIAKVKATPYGMSMDTTMAIAKLALIENSGQSEAGLANRFRRLFTKEENPNPPK